MTAFLQTVLRVAVIEQLDGTGIDFSVGAGDGLLGGAIGAFLTTLVVGALMIAIVPDYTDRLTATVLETPLNSFLYGFGSLLGLVLLAFVLFLTIVGILVAIPLLFVVYLLWAIGSAVAYLAIGERLLGREDGWAKPLVVGAGLNGALALTGVGGLLSFAIGAIGFGTILKDYLN